MERSAAACRIISKAAKRAARERLRPGTSAGEARQSREACIRRYRPRTISRNESLRCGGVGVLNADAGSLLPHTALGCNRCKSQATIAVVTLTLIIVHHQLANTNSNSRVLMAFGGSLGSAFDKSFHHHKTIMTTPSTSCPPPYPCRPSEFKTHSTSSTTILGTTTIPTSTTPPPPPPPCPPQPAHQDHLNNKQVDPSSMNSPDLERLTGTVAMLEASGWYYGQLSWQCAAKKLRQAPIGTFLVRDSADSRYLFSLSVQTERGPTSVRIHYDKGQFQLDAERRLAETMPLFDCVVALVEHYVRLSGTPKAAAHVWLDPGGRRDLAINLSGPLYHGVPTLQHLCRRTINSSVVPSKGLQGLDVLPKPLVDFVRQYPYGR